MPYRRPFQFLLAFWQRMRGAIASPQVRRYRAWLFQAYVIFVLVVFSALTLLANAFPVLDIDLAFSRALQAGAPGWFGSLLHWVSWPGYAWPAALVMVGTLGFLMFAGLRWEAASAGFAAASAWIINYLIKIAIRRPRPTEDLVDVFQRLDTYSFPSGHVMFYTTFFGFLLFLAYALLKRSFKRLVLIVLLGGLVLLVGASRMYVGEHWATDVVAGYLLGSLLLILSVQFYQWGKERYQIAQPVAGEGQNPQAPQPTQAPTNEDE